MYVFISRIYKYVNVFKVHTKFTWVLGVYIMSLKYVGVSRSKALCMYTIYMCVHTRLDLYILGIHVYSWLRTRAFIIYLKHMCLYRHCVRIFYTLNTYMSLVDSARRPSAYIWNMCAYTDARCLLNVLWIYTCLYVWWGRLVCTLHVEFCITFFFYFFFYIYGVRYIYWTYVSIVDSLRARARSLYMKCMCL